MSESYEVYPVDPEPGGLQRIVQCVRYCGYEIREAAQVTNCCPCGAQRTCRMVKVDGLGTLSENGRPRSDIMACSECGWKAALGLWDDEQLRYCPNCGAKVVTE